MIHQPLGASLATALFEWLRCTHTHTHTHSTHKHLIENYSDIWVLYGSCVCQFVSTAGYTIIDMSLHGETHDFTLLNYTPF